MQITLELPEDSVQQLRSKWKDLHRAASRPSYFGVQNDAAFALNGGIGLTWKNADFEAEQGTITLAGSLTLDYEKVGCLARIDLSSLSGTGYLERISEEWRECLWTINRYLSSLHPCSVLQSHS